MKYCMLAAFIAVGSALVVGPALLRGGEPTAAETVPGYTQPSDKREIGFATPGLVRELKVQEGQPVKQDDVLAVLDDREDRIELEAYKIDAACQADVLAAQIALSAKRVERERIEKIFKAGGGNDLEFEKTKYEEAYAQEEVHKAERDQQLKKLKADKQDVHAALMTLHSPIDGIVAKVDARVGEMAGVDRNKPCYVVVKNDPLWVEIDLPAAQAQALKPDQTLQVSHDSKTWEDARIIFFAPVADAASGTQKIRLELPNPQGRSSGLQVQIRLPKEIVSSKQ